MAKSAEIGSLRVSLGLDSAQFSAGISNVQTILSRFGAAVKGFAVGAAAAVTFERVADALKSSIDHMDALGKSAQKIGIPVEQLSGLEFAAEKADVSLGDLEGNLGRLNKALGEIAGGGTNSASAAMKAIGVSAFDAAGKLRSTKEIFADIAQKFSGYADGAGKAALAQALFGKSGADMIPLLNGGRQAIKEADDILGKFGGITTPEAAEAANHFNDRLTDIQRFGQSAASSVARGMLPALNNVVDALFNAVSSSDIFVMAGKGIGRALEAIASGFVALGAIVRVQLDLVVGFAIASRSALEGNFGQAAKWVKFAFNSAYDDAKSAMDRIKTLFGNNSGGLEVTVARKPAPVVFTGSTDGQSTTKQVIDDNKKINDSLYDMDLGWSRVSESAQSAGSAMANAIGGTLQDWIGQAIDGTFKWRDALQGLASQLAKMAANNILSGLFNVGGSPLYGGGPLSGIGKLLGFASGGTIFPGGSGGIDSQLVAFRKSPNERVDITKPGQTLTAGGAGVTVNVAINAPNADGASIAALRQQVQGMAANLGRTVKATVTAEFAANPRFAR